ncbi:MAG: cyclin family protein, partial [Planctomycetota bacterium]
MIAMDHVTARSPNELAYYLMVHPCKACGGGPVDLADANVRPEPGKRGSAEGTCRHCQAAMTIPFTCANVPEDSANLAVSPSGDPSEVIDVSQWLGLAYTMLDQAGVAEGVRAHQLQLQAAVCFAEAMKFYEDEDDELPPASAFFSESAQRAFHDHPEAFARQPIV